MNVLRSCGGGSFVQVMPGGVDVTVTILPGQLWVRRDGNASREGWSFDPDANTITTDGDGGALDVMRRVSAAVQVASVYYADRTRAREAMLLTMRQAKMVPLIGIVGEPSAAEPSRA